MNAVAHPDDAIALPEFFEDGELRLEESDDGWMGFEQEGEAYYFVDTRDGAAEWLQRVRVGTQAVRETIKRSVIDEQEVAA